MEPIERFVSTLRRGGIDLVRAQTILRENVGVYPDDVVRGWLEGDIIPGLSIRGRLFEAATQDPEDLAWECSTFLGPVPGSLVPGVNELCEAARRNEPERLALAIGGGVVIDGWDEGCDYALGYAAERGHASIARALLRVGADSITFATGKSNAYLRALQSGDAPMLRDFLLFGAASRPTGGADLNALLVVAGSAADNPEMISALDTHGRFEPFSFGFALAEAAKTGEPKRFFRHPHINTGRFFVAG